MKTPTNQVVGVTSTHFMDFSGSRLLEATWIDVYSRYPVAVFTKSYGSPGHEGSCDPMDLRPDYFLLTGEVELESENLLVLEEMRAPEIGEPVFFPNKNTETPTGYISISGRVTEASEEYYAVLLDQRIDLTARSGTPVISKISGKVIGILSRANNCGDKPVLYLTPSTSIYRAFIDAESDQWLQEITSTKLSSR